MLALQFLATPRYGNAVRWSTDASYVQLIQTCQRPDPISTDSFSIPTGQYLISDIQIDSSSQRGHLEGTIKHIVSDTREGGCDEKQWNYLESIPCTIKDTVIRSRYGPSKQSCTLHGRCTNPVSCDQTCKKHL